MSYERIPMIPTKIILHKKSKTLELGYIDNDFILPAFYLRSKSPSAETRKSPPPQNPAIGIEALNPLGNYALQILFDDGHRTGIYSWEYLRRLCIEVKNEEVQRKSVAKPADTQPLHIRPAPSSKK